MRAIDAEELRALLPVDVAVDALEEAFRTGDPSATPLRSHVETPLPAAWDPSSLVWGFAKIDLADLFEQLPPAQRDACHLYFLEGLDPLTIAERLGKQRNAVDQALHNGKKRLKELVGAG